MNYLYYEKLRPQHSHWCSLWFVSVGYLFHTKSLLKQVEQYGFPCCSLKMPWLSCRRQKAHTKCSGWNLRSRAEMQRPAMGSPQPPQRVPCREWKSCEQRGRPSSAMKQPSVKGLRQSWINKGDGKSSVERGGGEMGGWREMEKHG